MHYSSSLPITSAQRMLAKQASVVWHGFITGCSTLLSALHKATMLNWWSHKMLVGHSRSCISAGFCSNVQFKCHFEYEKHLIFLISVCLCGNYRDKYIFLRILIVFHYNNLYTITLLIAWPIITQCIWKGLRVSSDAEGNMSWGSRNGSALSQ